jgi:hypothetical protein
MYFEKASFVTIHKEEVNSVISSNVLLDGTDPFDGPEAPPLTLLICERYVRLRFVVPLATGGNFESSEETTVVVVLVNRIEDAHRASDTTKHKKTRTNATPLKRRKVTMVDLLFGVLVTGIFRTQVYWRR